MCIDVRRSFCFWVWAGLAYALVIISSTSLYSVNVTSSGTMQHLYKPSCTCTTSLGPLLHEISRQAVLILLLGHPGPCKAFPARSHFHSLVMHKVRLCICHLW